MNGNHGNNADTRHAMTKQCSVNVDGMSSSGKKALCLVSDKSALDAKRTSVVTSFANKIANQLRGTERYQAIQGRIVEAKLANQSTRLATRRYGSA